MSKSIYCIGKVKENETTMSIAVNEKGAKSKRVNIVSIKMVKENSILYKGKKITSSQDAAKFIGEFIKDADREELIVCSLDTKNQPTSIQVASIGSLNSSIVHPREIFKVAILSNAASIIIAHNHPSDDTTPSSEDINVTHRIKDAGKLLGIELIDHIIIGNERYLSLKEKGII